MKLNRLAPLFAIVLVLLGVASQAKAAEEQDIRNFLQVTGFDVAIASIQQGAMAGPALTGEDPDVFGRQWVKLAEEVFDPDEMISEAVEMLGAVMPDELLDHGSAFYSSPLGQRLVEVENESHMADDTEKYEEGERLTGELLEQNSIRIDLFREMGVAIGSTDTAVKSIVEIQVRYLMAAVAAGVSNFDISEEDLRLMLMEQAGEMRKNIEVNSLVANAYAYRALSDEELIDYLAALQDPKMGQVYEILNAVQYQIMAERYETLASRLVDLRPEQEL
ncbi:DUF2059 domain-containing protein [Aliiroseovarius sp. F47248L]|uniref:DUF2059 domain-containing protein n=1 Tax=Aliiroseovarius sp. F47248L TaxID=2926420 RepID=UPI001FF2E5BE|nr:DUF2059 domain-containing protein [Aliiroseovarius sp. F47248L]MCK0138676.1 DUF2059 domain-containing protein [Aliiroseovarius sp. F47248L]